MKQRIELHVIHECNGKARVYKQAIYGEGDFKIRLSKKIILESINLMIREIWIKSIVRD